MDTQFKFGPVANSEFDALVGAPVPYGGVRFYNSTAVALAVAGTASVPVLYNPPGSGVLARIQTVRLGVVAGTTILGYHGYGWAINPTLSALTAGPNPIGAVLGRGPTTPLLWYTTATWAAAPTLIASGLNAGGAFAAGPMFALRDDIGGWIILPPGCAFAPLIANAAVAATCVCVVDVYQTPIPTNF